ncbi:MAG TPA: DUF2589 domain-containing protein [Azospirillaceae bacterium]|nr:DUF2589 domain-containing protein [Azospirillaceae bacterium]
MADQTPAPADSAPPPIQTQATNLLSGIPFGNLIGGPLIAAVDAQGMAAIETVKFIEAVGFTSGDQTGQQVQGSGVSELGKAVQVHFSYQKNGQTYGLSVPLLTIVPIPFLRISTMNVDFTANIQADTSANSASNSSTNVTAGCTGGLSFFGDTINFNASVAHNSTSSSSSTSAYNVQYQMNVSIAAVQDAMPPGLQTILNILTNAAQPTVESQALPSS